MAEIQKTFSEDVEMSVLSVIIKDGEGGAYNEFIRLNGGENYFHLRHHKKLFSIMEDRIKNQKSIELVALADDLIKADALDAVGGPAGLTEIYTKAPTSAHFESHIEILRDYLIKRRGLFISRDLSEACENGDPEDVISVLENGIKEVSEPVKKSTDKKELVKRAVKNLQKVIEGGEEDGISYGFPEAERMTGKAKGNQLYIIAARPSMGKTSFMMNMIENVCMEQGKPTTVFSMEMDENQITEKYLYGSSGISYREIANTPIETEGDFKGRRKVQKGLLKSFSEQADKFIKAPIRIIDEPNIALTKLCSIAREDNRSRDTEAIFIDYAQLIKGDPKQPRERQVAEISASLKALSKELGIPVFLLCQLNRQVEGRNSHLPRMSDLRESGSMEQDADVIMLLHRFAYYAETEEEKAEASDLSLNIVAKCREGTTGKINMKFNSKLTKFTEIK